MTARPKVAILVVNGFDRRGRWGSYNGAESQNWPWIGLCLRQIKKHSHGWAYQVFAYDNSHLEGHRQLIQDFPNVRLLPREWVARAGRLTHRLPGWLAARLFEKSHANALDYMAKRLSHEFEYIVTLDTDSFPVHDEWLDALVGACETGASLSGAFRSEMVPKITPFIHVSGLCIRRADFEELKLSFREGSGQDVAQNITTKMRELDRDIKPFERSNLVNFHFLIGGVYGNVLYHHGAGSRKPQFWTDGDTDTNEDISTTLRNAAFENVEHLLEILRGQIENDLPLKIL